MKKILSIFALAFMASTWVHADENSIKQVITNYETALNAGKTETILTLYSQAPTFMPQHAPAQVGREAVRAAYENVFKAIDLDVRFAIHEVEILGDTAWVRTSSAGKTKILAGNIVIAEGNNELFIFKKEEGSWKIHQYLFSTNQPRN